MVLKSREDYLDLHAEYNYSDTIILLQFMNLESSYIHKSTILEEIDFGT